MALNSTGSIALHILENLNNVPAGVSGNMIEIVDTARINVENYTGASIDADNIEEKYQPPIINYAMANTIDLVQAQSGGEKLRLGELSVEETGEAMSSKQYSMLADTQLNNIGRKVRFSRSLS